VDVVEVDRIAQMLDRHGDRFLERCFTTGERDYAIQARRTTEHLAGRFAAKEAALKAIRTGWRSGISWTDVEVVIEASGAPRLEVTGRAAEIAAGLGIRSWHVSISHTEALAIASVIAEG